MPPLIGVAMKVIGVPLHTLDTFGLGAMVTEGANLGFTVKVKSLDNAFGVDAHAELEVIVQLTLSPFTKVEILNVLLEVTPPLFIPFTFH